jgi:hypothetical protein
MGEYTAQELYHVPSYISVAVALSTHRPHHPFLTMEEDLIVVDDLDFNTQDATGPSKIAAYGCSTHISYTGRPQRAATLRARRQSSPTYSDSGDTTSARPMRFSAKN